MLLYIEIFRRLRNFSLIRCQTQMFRKFADNFIEDLYVSDIQRVVAQSKNRPQTADDFRQYRRIVFTSGYSIQIHL